MILALLVDMFFLNSIFTKLSKAWFASFFQCSVVSEVFIPGSRRHWSDQSGRLWSIVSQRLSLVRRSLTFMKLFSDICRWIQIIQISCFSKLFDFLIEISTDICINDGFMLYHPFRLPSLIASLIIVIIQCLIGKYFFEIILAFFSFQNEQSLKSASNCMQRLYHPTSNQDRSNSTCRSARCTVRSENIVWKRSLSG